MRTLPTNDAHQARLLARADSSADQAESVVLALWSALLRIAGGGGPWHLVFARAQAAFRALPHVAVTVAEDLARAHRDAATWTAETLAATLPRKHRERLLTRVLPKRIPILEDTAAETSSEALDLITNLLLPPLDEAAVSRVVFASGWQQTIGRLTTLAAPDMLAAKIASAVQRGLSVTEIARELRPAVEGVQAGARRVARTAGLWVAHEAEREVYRGLEGDLILGYTVRAVLDRATRKEHRERDGHQFFVRPGPGQRPMSECPHPPREVDGSWAFNCRCWLEPIISVS